MVICDGYRPLLNSRALTLMGSSVANGPAEASRTSPRLPLIVMFTEDVDSKASGDPTIWTLLAFCEFPPAGDFETSNSSDVI